MELKTLGGLRLEGSVFKRRLPLLLLTYLAVEGGQRREHLADLFWLKSEKPSDKKQRLNNLSRTLSDLRKFVPGSFDADEIHVWTHVDIDLAILEEAVKEHDHSRVVSLYQGTFLAGQSELGNELGEWVSERRSHLANQVSQAYLGLAEADAATGRFEAAAYQAQFAYTLEEAPPPEVEVLGKFYTLLTAGRNVLAEQIKAEAEALGVVLQLSVEAAQARLRLVLLGREKEQEKLRALEPGSWAWLQGGVGIGKTSLLKSLPGTLLLGRNGLPFATLESVADLTGDNLSNLYNLRHFRGTWLIDDWERVDSESQELLQKLHDLKPDLCVVISARSPPPFTVDLHVELKPLSKEVLCTYGEMYEATAGIPTLVGAQLRGEALDAALENHLAALSLEAANLYLSLALLEQPDLTVVRRSLNLAAEIVVVCLDKLLAAGLVEINNQVQARELALQYLQAHPSRKAILTLNLARQLHPLEALSLYRSVQALWTDNDLPKVRLAYLAWADKLLQLGFPQQVAAALEEAPQDGEILFARAKALELTGRYRDALDILASCTSVPEALEVTALKGKLFWRLGFPEEAQRASQRALTGNLEVRAEALSTLGNLARSARRYGEAEGFDSRSAALWRATGNRERWGGALNNLALSEASLGKQLARTTFENALHAAGNQFSLRARILLNLGWLAERQGEVKRAERAYLKAIALAETTGVEINAALILNNLATLYCQTGRIEAGKQTYERALVYATQTGDFRALGMVMANLAELNEVYEAWLEALMLLEDKGHQDMATLCREGLPNNHSFRQNRLIDKPQS